MPTSQCYSGHWRFAVTVTAGLLCLAKPKKVKPHRRTGQPSISVEHTVESLILQKEYQVHLQKEQRDFRSQNGIQVECLSLLGCSLGMPSPVRRA